MSVAHTDDINENVEVPLSGLTADLDVFAEAVVAERAPSPPVVSHGNSRAIAAALAETESSVREPLLLPGEVVHVDRLATGSGRVRGNSGRLRAAFIIERAPGPPPAGGLLRFVVGLPKGLYFRGWPDASAAARDASWVIASDWARPVDRSVLTLPVFVFYLFSCLRTARRGPHRIAQIVRVFGQSAGRRIAVADKRRVRAAEPVTHFRRRVFAGR